MSYILKHDGHYFRIEIAEVANPDEAGKSTYAGWCSDDFRELKDMPRHACSRFVAGSPFPSYADALRHAAEFVEHAWHAQKASRPAMSQTASSVLYTVWLFKDETPFGFDFEEFSDAKTFAAAAEKIMDITKVTIKNNESPQNLTVWERE